MPNISQVKGPLCSGATEVGRGQQPPPSNEGGNSTSHNVTILRSQTKTKKASPPPFDPKLGANTQYLTMPPSSSVSNENLSNVRRMRQCVNASSLLIPSSMV